MKGGGQEKSMRQERGLVSNLGHDRCTLSTDAE